MFFLLLLGGEPKKRHGREDKNRFLIGGVLSVHFRRDAFLPEALEKFHIHGIIKMQFDETEPFRWNAIENEPANLL